MKKLFSLVSVIVMAALILAACAPAATQSPTAVPTQAAAATNTTAPTEAPPAEIPPTEAAPTAEAAPTEAGWMAPEGSALVAVPVDAAPELDGSPDDAAWTDAPELTIKVAGGFNNYSTEAKIKAVYTADSVYFLLTYADTSNSFFRSPWQKQEDGSWKMVKDPDDKGGDNNLTYEDKFSFIWNIDNSIKNFDTAGCFTACHAGENSDVKPYGNKYTSSEGEMGDIWHWKSVRNDGQIDDQYLDWTRFDAEKAPGAGRKSDAKDAGGYVDNFASKPDPSDAAKTVADNTKPGFTSPNVDLETGAPGYILDSEKVALDDAALEALPVGAYIPSIVKSPFTGDRGDISAGWQWNDGVWTIELGRALETGSETDVQFSDLDAKHHFGVAIFDNAQVRHAFQNGVSFLVFKPE